MDSSKVKVNIFGSNYTVQGEAQPEYISKLASFVDGKMNEVSRSVSNGNTLQIAILAALNIADEYMQIKEHGFDVDSDITKKANALISMLEEGLIGDFTSASRFSSHSNSGSGVDGR